MPAGCCVCRRVGYNGPPQAGQLSTPLHLQPVRIVRPQTKQLL